jgi:16S rRNA (guanine527-N7)-methyltransferase
MINELNKKLKKHSIKLEKGKEKLLEKFYFQLKEANRKINLISRRNFDNTFLTLSFQSIWLAEKLGGLKSFIDVGSGGGFPGIPIKIYHPGSKIYLVEPNKKKVNF